MPKKRSGPSHKKARKPAVKKAARRAGASRTPPKASRPKVKAVRKATGAKPKAKAKRSGAKPAATSRAAKKGTGLRKRSTEPRAKAARTQPVKSAAPVQRRAAPVVKAASKPAASGKTAAVKTAPVALAKPDAKAVLRRPTPPPPPPVPGKNKKKTKAERDAAAEARKAFLQSVIPTRIERLEILRQLYDKRREAPQKQAGTERPNEEEESEGEFVVSDEIVSSDSSEP